MYDELIISSVEKLLLINLFNRIDVRFLNEIISVKFLFDLCKLLSSGLCVSIKFEFFTKFVPSKFRVEFCVKVPGSFFDSRKYELLQKEGIFM